MILICWHYGMQAATHCEDTMSETKRIKMKIGDAEFEAEVPADQVQPMYDQFLAAIGNRPAISSKTVAPEIPNGALSPIQQPQGAMDEAILTKLYEIRPDGVITLRALPRGEQKEADTFLLLLYGYRRMKNEEPVLGTQLLQSAKYSGMAEMRPAAAFWATEQFVIRGGVKKGSTYQLNNPGVAKAEEIAVKIFS
jgi:hypothetical protein